MLKRYDQFLDGLNDYYVVHAMEYGFLFVVCVYHVMGFPQTPPYL